MATKLVVAISSRALFDLEESHQVFEQAGVDTYRAYQIEHENLPLQPGVAFPLVRKLLALNNSQRQRVEVILLSRNSADTGLRVFNSIQHHGLSITRAAFSGGTSPYRYASSFGAHLFLSADGRDVRQALATGVAAATIIPSPGDGRLPDSGQVKVAFDGDAVIFSDEAERIYRNNGLQEFERTESAAAETPLAGGPFKNFLAALHRIQREYSEQDSPIRTALVTARAAPAHKRVINTLRDWDIRIDEAVFLGGMQKGEFLKSFGADIFFDDQSTHIESASRHVATGHVPHGVANE